MKYVIHLIVAAVLVILGEFVFHGHLSPHFIAEAVIIVTVVTVEVGYDIYKNWKRIKLVLGCRWLALKNKSVRFSMSYQYRIKIKDKYLLVKNSNFDVYQHVGGKYKRLASSQGFLKDEFEASDDLKMQTTGLMKDDFAIFIPARKAIRFIDWFNKGKGREVSHWREFYEELIAGKGSVLSPKNFPYVNYNYVGRVTTPLKGAKGWDCYEILQFDVLDLIPTAAQESELEKLLEAGDTDYIKWADEELINCLGHDKRSRKTLYKIGHHAKAVLNMKWSED